MIVEVDSNYTRDGYKTFYINLNNIQTFVRMPSGRVAPMIGKEIYTSTCEYEQKKIDDFFKSRRP